MLAFVLWVVFTLFGILGPKWALIVLAFIGAVLLAAGSNSVPREPDEHDEFEDWEDELRN